MLFNQIKGQDRALRLINNAIKHDRISQSYIFHGPEGVGKFITALYFSMALNCLAENELRPCGICDSCHKFLELSHPDLMYIFPTPNLKLSEDGDIKETKYLNEYYDFINNRKSKPWQYFYFSANIEIRKDNIVFIQHQMETSQKEGLYRVCLIEDADKMNIAACNAFLKTLEEPLPNTVFVLLTTKLPALLPTIISRCQTIFFAPLGHRIIEEVLIERFLITKSLAKINAKLANGNLENAIRISNENTHNSRNVMIELTKAALKQDDMFLVNYITSNKDKLKSEFIHDVLNHLTIFLNDIVLIQNGHTEISNQDQIELIQQCFERIKKNFCSISITLLFIDDLHIKIDGNVNLSALLISLYNHVKQLFSGDTV
jgi:DNA polymerase III subunit delta'